VSRVTVDRATGTLRVAGAKTFPLGLSNPPPLGSNAPNGVDGLEEVADAGATFIRTGRGDWGPVRLEEQIAAERAVLGAAALHALHCWLYLGELPDLPARAAGTQASTREQMLTRPRKLNGTPLTGGQVLFEYVQEPPPPPIGAGRQTFRSVGVSAGGFRDWLGPHDAGVYRFAL